MRILKLLSAALLMGTFCTAGTLADDEGATIVMQDVLKTEKIRAPNNLVEPAFHFVPNPAGGEYVLMSAAIGEPGFHGIRYSWLYTVDEKGSKRLFKLPFDATLMTESAPWVVQGAYWVYDCYLCSSPESGYLYKIPVSAQQLKRHWVLKADPLPEERDQVKAETVRTIQNAIAKYGKTRPEPLLLKKQVTALFSKGGLAPEDNR